MYGRQSEIQRIQSKLQHIGQCNPHRVSAIESENDTRNDSEQQPQGEAVMGTLSVSASGDSKRGDLFVSTCDRYNSPAGKQALHEMGRVANPSHPLPKTVTSFPQRSWSEPVYWVDSEVIHSVHQLANTLRQNRYTASPRTSQQDISHQANDAWANRKADAGSNKRTTRWWRLSTFQPKSRFTVPQGFSWLTGAIIVRMGIDRLLIRFPALWIGMAVVVLTPVAIALYQTAVNPQSTVHSGRRLLVIMMGLLIGGQF